MRSIPILVVDDDLISQTILVKSLKKAGHVTASANNGNEALEILEKQFYPIVITDWMMPEMDGLELCRVIRSKELQGYVYIILVTSKESRNDIVTGLKAGADDYLTKPFNKAELLARINTGIRILGLERSLKKANDAIRQLSITDPLTGCYNRGYLENHLNLEIKRAMRYGRPLSVVMCDIDHFKKVNDLHGHQAGDETLKAFARCIMGSVRHKIDWVVRYGGEEFVIVLPETGCGGSRIVADRLREKIEKMTIETPNALIRITASFGGCCIGEETTKDLISNDALIALADRLLYKSKNEGRNRVNIHRL